MGESWTVNSEQTKKAYIAQVERDFAEHKYLTYPQPRIGVDRSIDQNSLFHLWLTELAAFVTPCHKKDVTAGMIEGTKRTVKGLYYRHSQHGWMVHNVKCPISKREKIDYTSSSSWKTGECFLVLTWMQMFAAELGCILESKGEFNKLQRKQNGE